MVMPGIVHSGEIRWMGKGEPFTGTFTPFEKGGDKK